jgi:hypothetical protein
MPVPVLCPGHASPLTFSPIGRLPSTVSAAGSRQFCSRLHRYYAAVRLLTSSATASSPRLPVVARIRRSGVGEMRSPRFRRAPFIRKWGLRPRQSGRTSHDGAQHVAFNVLNRLGLCNIKSFAGSLSHSASPPRRISDIMEQPPSELAVFPSYQCVIVGRRRMQVTSLQVIEVAA